MRIRSWENRLNGGNWRRSNVSIVVYRWWFEVRFKGFKVIKEFVGVKIEIN